jgi:hypothetical protein
MFLEGSRLSRAKEIVENDVIYEIFVAKFLILQSSPPLSAQTISRPHMSIIYTYAHLLHVISSCYMLPLIISS